MENERDAQMSNTKVWRCECSQVKAPSDKVRFLCVCGDRRRLRGDTGVGVRVLLRLIPSVPVRKPNHTHTRTYRKPSKKLVFRSTLRRPRPEWNRATYWKNRLHHVTQLLVLMQNLSFLCGGTGEKTWEGTWRPCQRTHGCVQCSTTKKYTVNVYTHTSIEWLASEWL